MKIIINTNMLVNIAVMPQEKNCPPCLFFLHILLHISKRYTKQRKRTLTETRGKEETQAKTWTHFMSLLIQKLWSLKAPFSLVGRDRKRECHIFGSKTSHTLNDTQTCTSLFCGHLRTLSYPNLLHFLKR